MFFALSARESPDIGVFVIDNSSYCGLASGIDSTASTAFVAVHYDCMLGYYSFAHEIGHLHGARHNTQADVTKPWQVITPLLLTLH